MTTTVPRSEPALDHRHLTARAQLRVVRVLGADRMVECWGEPPLMPRQTPEGVCFVGSAAGPLGGDVFSTTVEVGEGAGLVVGSVAATYARPGESGQMSLARVEADVGVGGRLTWKPEPLVAVSGCRHRVETTVRLAEGAQLFWAEVTVLGRHDEEAGDVWTRRSVDLAGRPLNRQEVAMTASGRSGSDPAVLGGFRVVASCLVVHPEWQTVPPALEGAPCLQLSTATARAGVLRLAGPAVEVVGLGPSVAAVLSAFDRLAGRLAGCAPVTAAALVDYVARAG